jgi:hypothetical protein
VFGGVPVHSLLRRDGEAGQCLARQNGQQESDRAKLIRIGRRKLNDLSSQCGFSALPGLTAIDVVIWQVDGVLLADARPCRRSLPDFVPHRGWTAIRPGVDPPIPARSAISLQWFLRMLQPEREGGMATILQWRSKTSAGGRRVASIVGGTVERLCAVTDMSLASLRVRLEDDDVLTRSFMLAVDGMQADCEILWQRGREVKARVRRYRSR